MEHPKDVTAASSYLPLVQAIDDFPDGPVPASYYQFFLPLDNEPHGYLLPETVQKIPWTAHFAVDHEHPRRVLLLDSSDDKDTATAVIAALAEVVNLCINRDLFHVLGGRHSELIDIISARYTAPVHIERFAAALFGITTRGAHLIAYNNTKDGMKICVPRRAAHLYTYPDMLDSTVAGGVKAGSTPFETMVEEAYEEASLPEDLVRRNARCIHVLSHMGVTGEGFPGEKGLVLPDYFFVYDIELPPDITPKPHDDEVGDFYCMSIDEVKNALVRGEFKPDSAAVLIFFLIHHKLLTDEGEEDVKKIRERQFRVLPFRWDATDSQWLSDAGYL